MNTYEKYISRCVQLAKNGLGTTYPNPMVGSVIVCDGKIIGEGWHRKAGEPHAEVNAVNSVKDKSLLKRATIYVSLEPCSHFGKTPPCSDLIIQSGIPNVVIGTVDPNIQVAGKGIKKLIAAGIHITVGVLEQECYQLNKRFFTFHNKKRPFVILKWAQSLDGFIAPAAKAEKKPVWITNPYSRQLVHKWRSEEQAILVGTQTAVDDNPRLDVRDWTGSNPIRIVIDANNRIPRESHLFDNLVKTIVIGENFDAISTENCIFERIDFEGNIAEQILEIIYNHQIQSVIIEGGLRTLQTFIESGLWDEARIFKSNTLLHNGVVAPKLLLQESTKQFIDNDELIISRNHD
ncbi:bifunctional diaminohydroxyphosphoribosylaminopyrimidine deaminase/5-amino-6-(5-phosphoribosylamino)uracil reductase RibD [Flavobacterium sp.]|uniref:bifunctional diaminohydroxyphosphoribosylaminopyrimidine deaminase/5-amino-6-(5-phosphoribosylamino)uracil reductase RibD n=1 Tax=Flavobacterium sp. TaxID=239 RepID=UPI00262A6456|nr:bifunctional diaminohydroxyphosphoribosylaminopyrimidine deaminase/5-amino-6-(5-phosphoribosylamino)uracil reductase RibD [Flavobacterium sp.]MDG2431777.1 bifunctional diaminohydroxyphosphoribosylaminopyrimidine deaminase/5-amino-6-(5-phosphoribosylamino)uracil reductase RibD [Flavobacterium sp.]